MPMFLAPAQPNPVSETILKIRLKLYASLAQYLPPGAEKNEAEISIAEGASVLSVLEKFGVPREHCHLVLVNGLFATPETRDTHQLKDGDHLAVWPPVAGG